MPTAAAALVTAAQLNAATSTSRKRGPAGEGQITPNMRTNMTAAAALAAQLNAATCRKSGGRLTLNVRTNMSAAGLRYSHTAELLGVGAGSPSCWMVGVRQAGHAN